MTVRGIWAGAVALTFALAAPGWGEQPPPAGTQVAQQERGDLSVRVGVPDPSGNQAIFGLPLDAKGIQPVWVEIENRGDQDVIYAPIATDPDYYSPYEVSWRFHDALRPEADAARDALFASSGIPLVVPPRSRVSGYVFTHRETGLKFVTITLGRADEEEDFRFILPVAGPKLAVEQVDFGRIYPPDAIREVDLAGLRAAIEALPCCGANEDGTGKADPLNLVIVGDGLSVVFPLVERGWRFVQPLDLRSAAVSTEDFFLDGNDPELPVSPMWVFGRREDAALEKPRDTISRRNHLRLWLTPLRYQGQSVFVGQISRDIGIEHTDKVWYLTTHKIDPDVDLDRDYLLQDLLLSGAVDRFGWVGGVGVSAAPDPRVNLVGDPYLTDGRRLVLFLGPSRPRLLPLDEVDWGP
ncbi:MAG: LssY C-terminal domain-containing protein [Amaricoccus sp.]